MRSVMVAVCCARSSPSGSSLGARRALSTSLMSSTSPTTQSSSRADVIGLVLAAGAGRRLRPYTDDLPKALVPIGGGMTVLESTLRNFADVGLTDAVIVVGYCADAIERRVDELHATTGVALHLVHND